MALAPYLPILALRAKPTVCSVHEIQPGRAGTLLAGTVARLATGLMANSSATATWLRDCGGRHADAVVAYPVSPPYEPLLRPCIPPIPRPRGGPSQWAQGACGGCKRLPAGACRGSRLASHPAWIAIPWTGESPRSPAESNRRRGLDRLSRRGREHSSISRRLTRASGSDDEARAVRDRRTGGMGCRTSGTCLRCRRPFRGS